MTDQRVTLLEFDGWANQPGRFVDLTDGAVLAFPVVAATIAAVRIGDWVVDRHGQVSDPPLVLRPGRALTFAAPGVYTLTLKRSVA